uniref:Uncharacterized protein n=1 Tax=Glycine max TaxID=3847 RepID=K7KSG3_SOYBN
MALAETNMKSSLQNRSNSLPNAPHPILSQIEEHCTENTDKLLQLRIFQQALAQECSNKQIDELLGTVKDCLLQSKDNMRELVSVIRRKRDAETGFTNEGGKYLAYKETFSMLSFLKEAEVVTRSSLESVLCFITGPISQLKLSSQSEYLCDSEVSDTNLFEMVDTVLKLLISSKPSSTENFQSHVQSLELCIEDIEVGVERLSRQLIRTRVTLLNILSH